MLCLFTIESALSGHYPGVNSIKCLFLGLFIFLFPGLGPFFGMSLFRCLHETKAHVLEYEVKEATPGVLRLFGERLSNVHVPCVDKTSDERVEVFFNEVLSNKTSGLCYIRINIQVDMPLCCQ